MSASEGGEGGSRRNGRPALDFIRKYFRFNPDTKKSKCIIGQCTEYVTGRHSPNLERHILRKHPTEASYVTMERIRMGQHADKNQSYHSELDFCAVTQPITTKRKASTISINMDNKRLMEACVELITVNSRPISLLSDSGWKRLVDPIAQALRVQDPMLATNRQKVTECVMKEAKSMREAIRQELKGRMVSVKIDTATRLDRSVLGINVQICASGQVVLYCLSVKELFSRHTAEVLRDDIMEVLNSYGVTIGQIYSVTTDNATNMVKAVQLIGEANASTRTANEEEEEELNSDADEDGSGGLFSETGDGADNTRLEDERTTETLVFGGWPLSVRNLVESMEQSDGVVGMRCAAHALQLAVYDALKGESIVGLVNVARKLVVKLRTPTAADRLNRLGRRKPILDCKPSWHSTTDMITSLLDLRDVSMEVSGKDLTDSEWSSLAEISAALLPARVATKKLQGEQLLVGDFLGAWLRCRLETVRIDSPLASGIVTAMTKREAELFGTPLFVSALYLDPRYHILLSQEEKKIAEEHLIELATRIRGFQGVNGEMDKVDAECGAVKFEGEGNEEEEDPLEKLLRSREAQARAAQQCPQQHKQDIKRVIRDFSTTPRIPKTENILQYWESKKQSDPVLYSLAMTVLALPMTQFSVERSFSHLKYIFNTLRSCLSPGLADDIMVVRCNRLFRYNS